MVTSLQRDRLLADACADVAWLVACSEHGGRGRTGILPPGAGRGRGSGGHGAILSFCLACPSSLGWAGWTGVRRRAALLCRWLALRRCLGGRPSKPDYLTYPAVSGGGRLFAGRDMGLAAHSTQTCHHDSSQANHSVQWPSLQPVRSSWRRGRRVAVNSLQSFLILSYLLTTWRTWNPSSLWMDSGRQTQPSPVQPTFLR